MSIKTLALAAIVSSVATIGSAGTYFEFGNNVDSASTLELGLIVAEDAGTVEVYDYHGGKIGTLLGSDELRAGANRDVRVSTSTPATRDVIAIIRVGGEVVASKDYDVNN